MKHGVAFGWAALCLAMMSVARGAGGGGSVLLSDADSWRKHYTFLPPVLADGTPARLGSGAAGGLGPKDSICSLFSTAPPPDWTQVAFDDRHWLLRPGREFEHGIRDPKLAQDIPLDQTNAALRGSDPFFLPVGLVCQRSRFLVNDSRAVRDLTLSLRYRGGFVAYLNGREIARAHLPAGPVEPSTPAEEYPPEAFFYRDSLTAGRPRPLDPKDRKSNQWALRERSFGPAAVPVETLRDGVNVLAVELHRGAYPPPCRNVEPPCATVGLGALELRAAVEPAPQPGAPSAALRARSVETTRTLFDGPWSAANDAEGLVTIEAVRNGTFAGQVIVTRGDGSSGTVEGLSATLTPLRCEGGGEISLPAMTVRYGAPNPLWPTALAQLGVPALPGQWRRDAGLAGGTRFDLLLDTPPAAAAAVPVWISVKPPRDVPAGEYRGNMTLRAAGAEPLTVALHVNVADWTLPDVKDYATLINLYQSPETLALYYKVQPWSEAHWRLIDRSMQLMGEMGNVVIFIPLLAESQMGNPESMVPWLKEPDGSYTYDFTVFDRYLDAALKHHDRLRFVSLNVWGYEASTRNWRGPKDYSKEYGARVTVVDRATGRRESVKLPQFGTPECEALWKPLLGAIRQRLARRELADKIILGIAGDQVPDQATAAMFHRLLPDAGWLAESHNLNPPFIYDSATKAAVPVRYNSIVYGGDVPDPAVKRLFGWQHRPDVLVMNFNRSGSGLLLFGYPPPWSFRMWMESTIACGRNGNGRVGADYWHIGAELLGQGQRDWGVIGGSAGTVFGRYLHSHADEAGLGRSSTDLFGPGPDGAVRTIRLENAREGIQETEARVFIEKALLNRAQPLPPDLAKRCRDLLDQRTNVLRLWKLGAADLAPQGLAERNRALFAAAAEVRRKASETLTAGGA